MKYKITHIDHYTILQYENGRIYFTYGHQDIQGPITTGTGQAYIRARPIAGGLLIPLMYLDTGELLTIKDFAIDVNTTMLKYKDEAYYGNLMGNPSKLLFCHSGNEIRVHDVNKHFRSYLMTIFTKDTLAHKEQYDGPHENATRLLQKHFDFLKTNGIPLLGPEQIHALAACYDDLRPLEQYLVFIRENPDEIIDYFTSYLNLKTRFDEAERRAVFKFMDEVASLHCPYTIDGANKPRRTTLFVICQHLASALVTEILR